MRFVKRGAVGLAAAGIAVGLVGCTDKQNERFEDAGLSDVRDDSEMDVINMADGFSNVGTKCDIYGNRIYVVFKGDSAYGAITVVPGDPTCD